MKNEIQMTLTMLSEKRDGLQNSSSHVHHFLTFRTDACWRLFSLSCVVDVDAMRRQQPTLQPLTYVALSPTKILCRDFQLLWHVLYVICAQRIVEVFD